MNKILKGEKRIMKKILNWLEEKPNHQDKNFHGDFHINQWCRIPDKTDWLEVGMTMYDLVEKNIRKTHPHLKTAILFPLASTCQSRIPKTLTKRNFRKNNYEPPGIYLCPNKQDFKEFFLGNITFLPEVSEKYQLKVYYSERKDEDGYYDRFIFMFR